MDLFKQKLKYGTNKIRYIECEDERQSALTYKWSKDKELGEKQILQGKKTIKKFRDFLNNLEL